MYGPTYLNLAIDRHSSFDIQPGSPTNTQPNWSTTVYDDQGTFVLYIAPGGKTADEVIQQTKQHLSVAVSKRRSDVNSGKAIPHRKPTVREP